MSATSDVKEVEISFTPQISDYKPRFSAPTEIIWNSPVEDKRATLRSTCSGHADAEKCFCVNNAIFKHDSSWSTAGHGKGNRNPCNMRVPRTWTPSVPMNKGTGNFARFETLADGVTACVELYDRFYDMLDPHTLVARWADNGANQGYKNAVASCF